MQHGETMPERLEIPERGQTLLIWSCWKQRPVHNGHHHPAPKSRDPPQRPCLPRLDPHFPWERDIGDAQAPHDPKKGIYLFPTCQTPFELQRSRAAIALCRFASSYTAPGP